MSTTRPLALLLTLTLLGRAAPATPLPVRAAGWPQLGRDFTRNAVSPEKDPVIHWQIEQREAGRLVRPARNVRWAAQLGGYSFASPVVADGLVWIGTDNRRPRDPAVTGEAGVLMCFRERDGLFLWQHVSPRRDAVMQAIHSVNSAPLVEGDTLYFLNNRAEVICLDIAPLRLGTGKPREVWKLDLIDTLGVCIPAECADRHVSCSLSASHRDRLFVITNNGVSPKTGEVAAPHAPSLACLDRNTGKVLWRDSSPGKNILQSQQSSPLVVEIKGRVQVIAPQGDGWVRSFDALTGRLIWKCDTNPKTAVYQPGGRGNRNYFLAAPVYYQGRVYITNGREPDDGPGPGRLLCIDPSREGDISAELDGGPGRGKPNPNSGVIWSLEKWGEKEGEQMGRSMSAVAIHDGLVIAPTIDGYLHCVDARTGKVCWTHDLQDSITSSPLIVDGKVYVGSQGGEVTVLALAREKKVLAVNEAPGWVAAPPIFSGGVLYLADGYRLYALAHDAKPDTRAERPSGSWPQWRGQDRLNLSSDTGLLDQWPKEGPPLAWQVEGIGQGVGGVAVAAGRVYVLGHRDTAECLTAIEEGTGKPLWSAPLGQATKEMVAMRWLSQRTPLVHDGRVHAVTARGELVCVDAAGGKQLWRKDYARDLGGRRGGFGICDQLLVDAGRLICVPGGKTATVAALDSRTGEVIWKCPLGDTAAYVGAVLVGGEGVRKHYVAVTAEGLVGVSTSGELLWRDTRFARNTANSCTPNVLGNKLFCAGNYGRGVRLLELTDTKEGVEAREVYHRTLSTPSWHEMIVCVGGHAYVGTNGGITCLDLTTGATLWQGPRGEGSHRPPYSGTYADGHLYVRSQRGTLALVEATPKGHVLKGMFPIPGAEPKPGSTAPVVTGGRLYLRDEERLLCYDVRRDGRAREPARFTVPPAAAPAPASPRQGREPDAIYVPTPQDVVEKMLTLAAPGKEETVVDLGCGDGRIVVTAARRYGCRAIGYDIDPECIKMSRENVQKHAVGSLVTIERRDLFTADLGRVDVVAVYLPPRVLEKLLPRLQKLRPGARIVSHAFAIPGVKPHRETRVASAETGLDHRVYLYTVPLKQER